MFVIQSQEKPYGKIKKDNNKFDELIIFFKEKPEKYSFYVKNKDYYKTKYNIQDKPVIGFYCHDAWEYWDEKSINSKVTDNKPAGIGGSETQAILVCRELSKLGYKVKIFNK